MKKHALIRFSLFALAGLLVVTAAEAQQAVKIAVVNSQKALEVSIEGKKIASQLMAKKNYFDKELGKIAEDIRQMESKQNTQGMTLTPEALTRLQADIQKKKTDAQRYQEDAGREFTDLREKLFENFRREMSQVVESFAKEKGYDLILDLMASGVVYFSPAIDVTDEAVRRYDATKTAPAAAPKK